MADKAIYWKQAEILEQIFKQTLRETAPERLVREAITMSGDGVSICGNHYPLQHDQNVWVFGTGKASSRMALAVEQILGDRIKDGMVITPHSTRTSTRLIQQFEASHPLPGRDSESATYELLNLARKIPKDDLVIYCLSGGTSSLLCMPSRGLELEDLRETHQLLIRSGANIKEINTVRKHLSDVKGGRLLRHLKDTRLVDLVISDVPEDTLEDIGSGPTTTDSSTFQQAFQILKKYRLWEDIPHTVRTHLAKGMHHEIPETPKPGTDLLIRHQTHILGSARKAAETAAQLGEERGFHTWTDSDVYTGDVGTVSERIANRLHSVLREDDPVSTPAILVFYGESTVEVTGNGVGGRNQELALRAALLLDGHHHITLLSGGTDGRDGPTDAAGALCNGATIEEARQQSLAPDEYLQNNNSYHFFESLGQLLKTGPTGNNVMDLQIGIVEKDGNGETS